MKNVNLKVRALFIMMGIVAMSLVFVSCQKDSKLVQQNEISTPKNTTGNLTSISSGEESETPLQFSEDVRIYNIANGNDFIDITISSDNSSLLENYMNDVKLSFKTLDPSINQPVISDYDTTSNGEINDFALKIDLHDADHAEGYELIRTNLSTGSSNKNGYEYEEDFSSTKDNVTTKHTITGNASDGLYCTIRYKMCGVCSKYTLNNYYLYSGASQAYYKSSARLYLTVLSHYKNYTCSFY